MALSLLVVQPRASRSSPAAGMVRDYIERAGRYAACGFKTLASEAAVAQHLEAAAARRTKPFLILADSRGKQLSSKEFARIIGGVQDSGVQQIALAIGPADGWSDEMRGRANLSIAFGRITLPHELAAVVAAEQIYRALTILAGHPYHSGH